MASLDSTVTSPLTPDERAAMEADAQWCRDRYTNLKGCLLARMSAAYRAKLEWQADGLRSHARRYLGVLGRTL